MKNITRKKENIIKYLEKLEKGILREKEIISNTDYIVWLEKFTSEHPYFMGGDWLYQSNKISKEDYQHVLELTHLYMGIDKYANKNYLYPTLESYTSCYLIKFNETYFEIGIFYGQGTSAFCNRIKEVEKDEKFIDFNDVINNKEQASNKEIKKKLEMLSNFIETLTSENIPLEAIFETTNTTIEKLKKQQEYVVAKKGTSKKLKK